MRTTATSTKVLGSAQRTPVWPTPAEGTYLLLQETNHRLMDTFAFLAGRLKAQRPAVASSCEAALSHAERLITAHSELHRWLALGAWAPQVQVGEYVSELCRRLSVAILEPLNLRCDALVEDGVMPGADCERLGLILCELVLDAAKYAFPDGTAGCIRVVLMRHVDSWRCTVADDGLGFRWRSSRPRLRQVIVDTLAHDLGATISVRSCRLGTAIAIVFPTHDETPPGSTARAVHPSHG